MQNRHLCAVVCARRREKEQNTKYENKREALQILESLFCFARVYIYALRKAHMHPTPSLKKCPCVAFDTVPVLA